MSLPESLERAATALPALGDRIRPANGDPFRLLELLEPADAASVLGWVVADDERAGEELLDAFAEQPKGALAIAAVREEALPKPARKALRRALHRLRAQGVVVEAPAASSAARAFASGAASGASSAGTPAIPSAALRASDRFRAAHVSAPDFRGTRMAYLVDDHPSGGARLFEIRFDPARGILDFKLYNAGRSKVRGFLKSLVEGTKQRLFEVDHDAVCALVRRASRSQPADRPLPTFFVEWRSRLFGEALDAAATPGAIARREVGRAEDAEKSLVQVSDSIREGRIGPWPPSTVFLSESMERGRTAVAGLEGAARATELARFLDQMTEELAQVPGSEQWTDALEEWAWVEWQRAELESARALLAVAAELAGQRGAEVRRTLARARAEALFGPFIEALKLENESK